ncbi:hypothetical protein [Paucibacter sp. B51]|uniref:hypothetical protein n=1 Tax=Paucibacter sp. B51 TaxID=2993315 RepID=UPI0022EBF4FE|nr:hypothetical protein [Paucibacter sp. B51]
MKKIRVGLIGYGAVNQNLLRILQDKQERLLAEYELQLQIVLVADSRGFAIDAQGFEPAALLRHKAAGGCTADLGARWSHRAPERLAEHCDLIFEASPVNLKTGEPGLSLVRAALADGVSVVLANKGPLVLAFHELHELAAASGAGLRYSATVCGGLPVLNIARRDMVLGRITRVRGVFNSTTNFILESMRDGKSFAAALDEAQRRGIAEADPSLDIGGWDTANKLLIILNSVTGERLQLKDIQVSGIADMTIQRVQAEQAAGRVIRLVAEASEGRYTVAPVALEATDFLAQCNGWEMALEYHSDIYGISYHKLWEREPAPTAASMLRDAVHILSGESLSHRSHTGWVGKRRPW